MGKETKIGWTATKRQDGSWHPGSTLNWWIGCTKISPGCKFCYAERQNTYYKWTDKGSWGKGAPRKLTSERTHNSVFTWAKCAFDHKQFHRVFVSSLSDVFDDEVPDEWRNDLWNALDRAGEIAGGYIEFLILTKRIENAQRMFPERWIKDPDGNLHIRLGITTENQDTADARIPILLEMWPGKNFISAEPLLSYINFKDWITKLDWVIVGGESGPQAREMNWGWAKYAWLQCSIYGIPFYMKQSGSALAKKLGYKSTSGSDPEEWPEHYRVREIP